jgi:hypothetical protein
MENPQQPNELWYEILQAKYLGENGFFWLH